MLKSFKRPGTVSDDATRVSLAVEEYTNQLTPNPVLDGRLISRVAVSSTPISISHGLNRAWKGWFLTRISGNVVVYEGTQTDTTKFLNLVASGSATVDIYIF